MWLIARWVDCDGTFFQWLSKHFTHLTHFWPHILLCITFVCQSLSYSSIHRAIFITKQPNFAHQLRTLVTANILLIYIYIFVPTNSLNTQQYLVLVAMYSANCTLYLLHVLCVLFCIFKHCMLLQWNGEALHPLLLKYYTLTPVCVCDAQASNLALVYSASIFVACTHKDMRMQ